MAEQQTGHNGHNSRPPVSSTPIIKTNTIVLALALPGSVGIAKVSAQKQLQRLLVEWTAATAEAG